MKKINTILIVDDDKASSFLITMTLEEMGIAEKIVSVFDGQQALDFLQANSLTDSPEAESYYPAFILLDLNMPIMSGFEFLEAFQTRYPAVADRIPVCILTSSASARDLLRAQQYNLAGFITKPLTPASLTAILAHL